MNPLTELTARLRQAELNVAVRIDDRDLPRIIARHWSHSGPRVLWVLLGALPALPLEYSRALALALLATTLTLVYVGSRLADRTHEVGWIDRVHPCPLCPNSTGGGGGHGGGGWNGDDFPTAPPPMSDYDDERIRAMAGDLDAQLTRLLGSDDTSIPGRHVPSSQST